MRGSIFGKTILVVCSVAIGISLGICWTHHRLELAKDYSLKADRAVVEAIQLNFETEKMLDETSKLATEALDMCLGRVSL